MHLHHCMCIFFYLKRDELRNFLDTFKNIESIDFHLSIAKRQRDSYNFMRENLEKDYIFIEMDWKQKITIGLKTINVFC